MKYQMIDVFKIGNNINKYQYKLLIKDIKNERIVDWSEKEIKEEEQNIIVAEGVKMPAMYKEENLLQYHVAYADPFGEREIFPTWPYSVAIITYMKIE